MTWITRTQLLFIVVILPAVAAVGQCVTTMQGINSNSFPSLVSSIGVLTNNDPNIPQSGVNGAAGFWCTCGDGMPTILPNQTARHLLPSANDDGPDGHGLGILAARAAEVALEVHQRCAVRV
jgi:hypothetical protein